MAAERERVEAAVRARVARRNAARQRDNGMNARDGGEQAIPGQAI